MRKGFGAISVVAILGVLLVLVLFFTKFYVDNYVPKEPTIKVNSLRTPEPSVDETANWKVYTNTDFGYSIKTPQGWKTYFMKDYPYEGYPGVINPNGVIITSFPRFPKMMQAYEDSDHYVGFGVFKPTEEFAFNTQNLEDYEVLKLNGLVFYKKTYQYGDQSWYIVKDGSLNNGVSVSVSADSIKGDKDSLIEQSIKTLKFLE